MSYQLENTQRGEKYNSIFSKVSPAKRRNRTARAHWRSRILLGVYLILMILPIYWLINMSLQTNSEILGSMTLWPQNLTFDNYIGIFTNASWYMGYVNSMLYVAMNMLITICVALPAAYAFSRYTFYWRQASVLLAANQPNGSACGLSTPLLPALLLGRPVRYPHRRRAGSLPVQYPSGDMDFGRLHEQRT